MTRLKIIMVGLLLTFGLSTLYAQSIPMDVFENTQTGWDKTLLTKAIFSNQPVVISSNVNFLTRLQAQGKLRTLRKVNPDQWVVRFDKILNTEEVAQIKRITPANSLWKLSDKLLREFDHPIESRYTIVGLVASELKGLLTSNDVEYRLVSEDRYSKTIDIELSKASEDLLKNIISHPKVIHLAYTASNLQTESILNSHDLSFNRVNKLHSDYPHINGSGITVSIKEDNYDETDIDIKSRNKISEIASEVVTPHATDMATIIGGAGNSFIKNKGAAWACQFTSSNFEKILPDDNAIFQALDISVQNHSYGLTTTDNRYGAEARAYDLNANANKSLLHIFSSGNLGLTTTDHGTYNGISGYANLSGNFKMAKNILIVNGINKSYQVDERNSNGPAYDGRLKPELVVFGTEGTSNAAAMVSGISALLQQAYQQEEGVLPASAMIKSLLIAGATDVGAEGIDYITGYGNINADKSMQIILNEQYTSGNVEKGLQSVIDFKIPPNAQKLKVAIVWNDPPAQTGDAIALVNDLDFTVKNVSTGDIWLPWVLNSAPDPSKLDDHATRQKDHLNNVEYITIDMPDAGDYQMIIEGTGLITSNQIFHVAYFIEEDGQFQWDYPTSADKVIAGEETILRWSGNIAESTSIELTLDQGNTWETISTAVDITSGQLTWQPPATSAKAQLRVLVAGRYIASEEFILAPVPNVSVGYDCDDSFMITWDKIEEVDRYRVYEIGEKYLQLIEEVTDTLYVFDKADYSDYNYAVTPVVNDALEGNASLAFDYRFQGVRCYERGFFVTNASNQHLVVELHLGTTYLVKELIFERSADSINYDHLVTLSPTFPQLTYVYNDQDPIASFSYYRARIIIEDGREILLDPIEAFFPDQSTMIISPNPIQQGDAFTLLSKGDGRVLELLDMNGKIIRQWTVDSNLTSYSISAVQKGIYLLRMTTNGKTDGFQRLMIY